MSAALIGLVVLGVLLLPCCWAFYRLGFSNGFQHALNRYTDAIARDPIISKAMVASAKRGTRADGRAPRSE